MLALVVAVVGAGVLPPAAGPAAAQPATGGTGGQATTELPCGDGGWGVCDTRATDRGYEYRYQAGKFVPQSIGSRPGAAPAGCGDNCPPNPCDVYDLLVAAGPPVNGTAADIANYNNQLAANDCPNWLAGNNAVPLANVQNALADYLRQGVLPDPSVTVEPTGRSFANLPTLFHTPIPNAFTFPVDQPIPATITAEPHYRWDFGDGKIGPDAPGRPFDPAISPREHPDAYVSHGYGKPGPYRVTLTVTWFGSFTVPGVAQAFPLPPVTLVAAADVAVQESVGVLTGSN
jgi:hypothetical protein